MAKGQKRSSRRLSPGLAYDEADAMGRTSALALVLEGVSPTAD
jgi:hypothetical protein